MFSRFDRPDIRKNLFNKFLNKRKPVVDKEEEEEEEEKDEPTPIEPGIDYKKNNLFLRNYGAFLFII